MHKILTYFGLPPDYSVNGHEIDNMIVLIHWLMLLLFVGWGIFFVITLIKFRKGKNPKADYKGVKNHYNTYVEVAVIVAEAVLLVGFSIPLWAKRTDNFPPKNESVVVRVLAEQFAWNIHYPGADGVFGKTAVQFMDPATNPLGIDPENADGKDDITTINQLNIPINKNIILEMTTKDVIHSFGVPVLRVKQDVMPGQMIPIWFQAKKTGTFHITCNQLCGIGHYRMAGFINIKTQEDFDNWLIAEGNAKAEEESGEDVW